MSEKKRRKKPLNITVGENIRNLRKKADDTQEELAEYLGKSTNHISEIERGVSGLTMDVLDLLCKRYGVTADAIIHGDTLNVNINEIIIQKIKQIEPKYHPQLDSIITAYLETIKMK